VNYLVANGKHVGIVSFSDYKLYNKNKCKLDDPNCYHGPTLINRYMDALFGKDRKFLLLDHIVSYLPTKGVLLAHAKNKHIEEVAKQFGSIKNQDIVLFEDNYANYLKAKEIGIASYYVPNRFTRKAWKKISVFSV